MFTLCVHCDKELTTKMILVHEAEGEVLWGKVYSKKDYPEHVQTLISAVVYSLSQSMPRISSALNKHPDITENNDLTIEVQNQPLVNYLWSGKLPNKYRSELQQLLGYDVLELPCEVDIELVKNNRAKKFDQYDTVSDMRREECVSLDDVFGEFDE